MVSYKLINFGLGLDYKLSISLRKFCSVNDAPVGYKLKILACEGSQIIVLGIVYFYFITIILYYAVCVCLCAWD